MIETVKTFLENIKEQGHVQQLLFQGDLRVTLNCQQQAVHLVIKNGGIFILQGSEESQTKYEISGNLTAMEQLLAGKERLRVLEKNGQLKVSAPLRVKLLLESIFFLTKTEKPELAKII
ncbi:SCP2 sterol-binding domain-containing protein [Neobacillus sp.]|uniref:SCP2 sterol-binding domain-containing protein n=1 Tax=Neobacillus sp. TaxID=2675273 RepID=UPI002896BD3E|nr:SCP2 sterol-binding domain-containing protein [Neobacillus sp.]